jgi:bZIP transcription factor
MSSMCASGGEKHQDHSTQLLERERVLAMSMMDERVSSDEEVSASASTVARQRRIEQRQRRAGSGSGIKRRKDNDESYGSDSDNDDDDSYSSATAVGAKRSSKSSKKPRLLVSTNLSLIRGVKKQARYEPEVPMPKSDLAKWRKEARRVRNRESAAASRHKTRLRIEELEGQVAQLQGQCHDLEQLVAQLHGQTAAAEAAAATAVPDEASVISCVSPLLSPTVIALNKSGVPEETNPRWTLPQQTAAQVLADSVSTDTNENVIPPPFDTKGQHVKELNHHHPRGLEEGPLYPTHQNLMISRPIAI